LLYRYPNESAEQLVAYYQDDYVEEGLTTDLPTRAELEKLLDCGFRGTSKDFGHLVALLQWLGVESGARVLDYGANWGYGVWQLQRAGYDARGYEISRPRASYGRRLGVEIHTALEDVAGPLDVVYSGHVLEHTPDPAATLRRQLALVEPGGYVIAHTPNGARARQENDFRGFHLHWGEVHPVLISDGFLRANFGDELRLMGSDDPTKSGGSWQGHSTEGRPLDGKELLFVLQRSDGAAE